jgi:hypothetical protein
VPVNLFFTAWHGHPRQPSKFAGKRWHIGDADSQTKRTDDTSVLFYNWVQYHPIEIIIVIDYPGKDYNYEVFSPLWRSYAPGSNAMRDKTTH